MSPSYSLVPVSDLRQAQDAALLEQLAHDVAGPAGTLNDLMREHLEAARFYLLGAMRDEYRLELQLAKQLLPAIEDKSMQARVADFLRSQGPHGNPG